MTLWILRPRGGLDEHGRWDPGYDRCWGVVVRAETEAAARDMAALEAGDEGAESWTDPKHTTCRPLTADGDPGVVIKDFMAG